MQVACDGKNRNAAEKAVRECVMKKSLSETIFAAHGDGG